MPTTRSTEPEGQTLRTDRSVDSAPRQTESESASSDPLFYTHQVTMLSVSSGMVGVCLTAIGLIRIIKSLNKVEMFVDDMLAIAALMFMVTALLTFFGMRTRLLQFWRGISLTIDIIFCMALVLVATATAILTWEVF